MVGMLAVAFLAVLWRFGRSAFTGTTKWLLWALSALCASAGGFVLVDPDGQSLPLIGAFALWAFAAYSIKVAGAARKRR